LLKTLAILAMCSLVAFAGTSIAQRYEPFREERNDYDYGGDCENEVEDFQQEVRKCLEGAATLDAAKKCWRP
jgi:hypothetical protein